MGMAYWGPGKLLVIGSTGDRAPNVEGSKKLTEVPDASGVGLMWLRRKSQVPQQGPVRAEHQEDSGKDGSRRGGTPGPAPPVPAARGRRNLCSALPGRSWRLTSPGSAEAAGHKDSFVRQRRLCTSCRTKLPAPGLAGVGAAEAERKGLGLGPRAPPPHTCGCPAAADPRLLAGDEILWPPGSEGDQRPPPPPASFWPQVLGPIWPPLPLTDKKRNPRPSQDTCFPSEAQAWIPLSSRCAGGGWGGESCPSVPMPSQQEASAGDGSFPLS